MFYFESTVILSSTLHSSLRVTTQKQPLRRWTIILTGALQSCCNEDIAALKTSKKMQETGNKKHTAMKVISCFLILASSI